ncbi:SHPS1 phosphatase, partial [Pterocles burchelli]|nr:SHPS1 phosphatase [Pterocles burchelli]
GAQAGQRFELQQPQVKVSVTAGETISLTCTVSGIVPTGPVRWLKGWGDGNETVYGLTCSNRVTRVVNGSDTDFSIHIRDARPEDAGTYYCVKFRKLLTSDELFAHGKGTEVSLHEASPLPSVVAAAVVLGFLLLLLSLFLALCMYRRKRRGDADSQHLAGPAAVGSFLPIPLRCCVGTPGTPSEILDAETSHLPQQQSSKEDNTIHYADLQPLPPAPQHGRSPGAACSEYASVRVTAK